MQSHKPCFVDERLVGILVEALRAIDGECVRKKSGSLVRIQKLAREALAKA